MSAGSAGTAEADAEEASAGGGTSAVSTGTGAFMAMEQCSWAAERSTQGTRQHQSREALHTIYIYIHTTTMITTPLATAIPG